MTTPKPPLDRDQRPTRPEMRAVRRYRVRIFYTEPTYAQQRELPPTEYTVSYIVGADDPATADALGRERFRAEVAREGVGWTREVVRVECSLESRGGGAAGGDDRSSPER